MSEQVEHWFNRRYGVSRRDVYLMRTAAGWQVLGREAGSDGRTVAHDFVREQEEQARAMVRRMLETVPPELSSWAEMTASKHRPSKS